MRVGVQLAVTLSKMPENANALVSPYGRYAGHTMKIAEPKTQRWNKHPLVKFIASHTHVVQSPNSPDGRPCYVWQGPKDYGNQDGRLYVDDRKRLVRRLVAELAEGDLGAQQVVQKCATPFCVAPHHIKLRVRNTRT